MTADRKKVAMRKLEEIVRIIFRADETSLSGMQHGRLAVELRRLLARLKRLLQDDPDMQFWDVLQQAILKTLKYLRRV
ncbi:MAG: hypothetical protein LAO19_21955 [Acidobacteriia bacterium]|nr:hypothetical protein [Terriglobia bacterium]